MKDLEKSTIFRNRNKFGRSYAKTDVTIKSYGKNYPYRLMFKSVRLKTAENVVLTVCKQLYTLVDNYRYRCDNYLVYEST